MSNDFMTRRGVESNPWNLPEEDLAEWSNLFSGRLPNDAQPEFIQFDNVDEELLSEDSDATTLLMDIDDDDDNAETVQQEEITSTTSTISTLNAINMMEIRRRNLWILQPAFNSIYDNLPESSPYHYKQSTGNFQMKISNTYNNAILTSLNENACFVQSRDICPIQTIQGSLFHLMLAMKHYSRLQTAEKESLLSNFGYLKDLIMKMEDGFRAQREWNLVIQSLFHNKNHGNFTRDLQSIDLPSQVKRAARQCPDLAIYEQPPVTTLFEKYMTTSSSSSSSSLSSSTPSVIDNGRNLSEKEIDIQKMYTLIKEIDEMIKYANIL